MAPDAPAQGRADAGPLGLSARLPEAPGGVVSVSILGRVGPDRIVAGPFPYVDTTERLEPDAPVPYRRDTLLFVLNTARSIHGVT